MMWVRNHIKQRRYPYGRLEYTAYSMELHVSYSIYLKYRRKVIYGEVKRDLVEIIKTLCEMKQVNLIDWRMCMDHLHMQVTIPPRLSVSEVMLYPKGKSALMVFDRHPEMRPKWGDRHFWAIGYYVSTVGNVNEEMIRNYTQNQEANGKLEDRR